MTMTSPAAVSSRISRIRFGVRRVRAEKQLHMTSAMMVYRMLVWAEYLSTPSVKISTPSGAR